MSIDKNDFIKKRGRKYFRVSCPQCGTDKGYKDPASEFRLCYKCQCERATLASNISNKIRSLNRPVCSIDGCTELVAIRGMCQKCYDRFRRPRKKTNTSCVLCGTKIFADNGRKKYCSATCITRAYYKRRFPYSIPQQKQSILNAKISNNLRSRISRAIRKNLKGGSAVRDLGCSIEQLKQFLELKFKPNMTWDNYGKWHIDHIIPLSLFDLSDPEQFKKACHYTNLQPLWAKDNIKKSNKLLE